VRGKKTYEIFIWISGLFQSCSCEKFKHQLRHVVKVRISMQMYHRNKIYGQTRILFLYSMKNLNSYLRASLILAACFLPTPSSVYKFFLHSISVAFTESTFHVHAICEVQHLAPSFTDTEMIFLMLAPDLALFLIYYF
jgi:hypothetical protein